MNDIFDDIIDTLKLQGTLYFRTDFNPPWSVTVPDFENAQRFHYVVQGQLWVKIGREEVFLNAGDLIVIPKGRTHILADEPVTSAPPLERVLEEANYDGQGIVSVGTPSHKATQLICGHFTYRPEGTHPLLQIMPDYVHIRNQDRAISPLLDQTLRLMMQQSFQQKLGSNAAMKRLSEVVCIELMRDMFMLDPKFENIAKALQDPQIGKALSLMHSDIDKAWSVQNLAHEIGMSRSNFASRFMALLGIGPMAYLAEWRMQKALAFLQESRLPVAEIAHQVGYGSTAAFSRAFTKRFQQSPKEYKL